MTLNSSHDQLHAGHPVLHAGAPLANIHTAMILLHGRGATAESILGLTPEFKTPNVAYLAPQAANFSWYPQRFLAPLEANQPWLDSALGVVANLLEELSQQGIPARNTVLLGFSQGACLALEYAARNPQRYGGVVGLSGGLIGPPGTQWESSGSLERTPAFLGCGVPDPHIPKERVLETQQVLTKLGAQVTSRLYPQLGHTVNQEEIKHVQEILANID